MWNSLPKSFKILLSSWVALTIITGFIPPVGTAMDSVGTALGRVAPTVFHSVPASAAWGRTTVCDRTEKC